MATTADVVKVLRTRLSQGEWRPGDKFLTYAEAREEFAASIGTVRRAFAELRGEGLLTIDQGRPPFVNALPPAQGVDVLEKLEEARAALSAAMREIERQGQPGSPGRAHRR